MPYLTFLSLRILTGERAKKHLYLFVHPNQVKENFFLNNNKMLITLPDLKWIGNNS